MPDRDSSERFVPQEAPPGCGNNCQAQTWAQTMLREIRALRSDLAENAAETAREIGAIKERLAKGDAKLDDASKSETAITNLTTTVQALTVQLVELKTKLGVLWAIAGVSGVAAIGSLVTALIAVLKGHP